MSIPERGCECSCHESYYRPDEHTRTHETACCSFEARAITEDERTKRAIAEMVGPQSLLVSWLEKAQGRMLRLQKENELLRKERAEFEGCAIIPNEQYEALLLAVGLNEQGAQLIASMLKNFREREEELNHECCRDDIQPTLGGDVCGRHPK